MAGQDSHSVLRGTRRSGAGKLHGRWCAAFVLVACSNQDEMRLTPGATPEQPPLAGGAGGEASSADPGRETPADGAEPTNDGTGTPVDGSGGNGNPAPGSSVPVVGATPPVSAPPDVPACEPATGVLPALRLTPVATGLAQPTFVTAAPGDDTRLFVLERAGTIRIVKNGEVLAEPFLDLTGRVESASSLEEGLLGLAFHPRYQENGRLFVEYASAPVATERNAVLAEFVRSGSNPEQADLASERRLIVAEQASDIHWGGMLAFHPFDGLLYLSLGDAGYGRVQDLSLWAGKMLRIDVDAPAGARPYGIPAGNMTGNEVLPEIWSVGWRNPWRFSFDACTADMYIGDVGDSSFEEIDFEPANTPGRNYGWNIREGSGCYESSPECPRADLIGPILEYERPTDTRACSVIGGYVYRGRRIPALRGTYIYSDFCSAEFVRFRVEAGRAVGVEDITEDINPGGVDNISSFGVDNAGEVYVVSLDGGLYRIDPE